ncbi:MAG: tetratricopeptide repeat protein [Lachnospiraceae bacterium]|nr:tetratricopeptide repeat protein [Lachnospiraceae bacterium]
MERKDKSKRPISHILYGVILALMILLLLSGLFFAGRYTVGAISCDLIRKGKDATKAEQFLLHPNFPGGYVPYYNLGNIAYAKGDFDSALSYYYAALQKFIPEGKECPIRVNLALSILEKIDWENFGSEQTLFPTVQSLQAARQILIEKDCAHADDEDGHNPEAQKLKDEIDKLLNQLGAQPNENQDQQNNNGQSQDQDQNSQGGSSSRENKIKDRIKQQKEEAQKERSDEQDSMRQYFDMEGDGDSSTNPGGKAW